MPTCTARSRLRIISAIADLLRRLDIRGRLARVPGRFDRPLLGRIAQAALAAGLAWELALQIPGHGQPFFAPIAAVIALGAERGRRGKQAILMMTGVSVGILIGAALVAIVGAGGWQIVLATALALLVTTGAGASPLVRNQAAASAILVVALHPPGSNLAVQRLVDALIGGAIAIVLARFLFPIDPLELVRDEARSVREQLASALEDLAGAVGAGDRAAAEVALRRIDAVDETRLAEALGLAREIARQAPRRRPLRRRIEALGDVYRELEGSVLDARAIATGSLRLVDGAVPSADAAAAVRAAATAVRAIEPAEARARADAARTAARDLRAADPSLGAGVLAHGIAAVADHTERAAAAREEDARLAAGARNRFSDFYVAKVRRP